MFLNSKPRQFSPEEMLELLEREAIKARRQKIDLPDDFAEGARQIAELEAAKEKSGGPMAKLKKMLLAKLK